MFQEGLQLDIEQAQANFRPWARVISFYMYFQELLLYSVRDDKAWGGKSAKKAFGILQKGEF